MTDTTLSPRLRHLLIQEDRKTGELYMPFNPASTSRDQPSPPFAFQVGDKSLPSLNLPKHTVLPPISASGTFSDRRQSTGLFSLLNDLSVASPPSSASSIRSAGRSEPGTTSSLPQVPLPPTPQSAPLPASQEHYRPYFAAGEHRHSVVGSASPSHRPDILRRHSSHPYEYPHQPHQHSQNARSEGQPSSIAYAPISGSRAPISRTTKACNACRGRKVRCDAGNLASGETGTCSRCKEAGVECIYTGIQKKRGPCPGSARPPSSAGTLRTRRLSSQRSSFASTGPTTPPEDLTQTWTSRNSYGSFPQGGPYGHQGPIGQYTPTPQSHSRPHSPLYSSYQTHPQHGMMSAPPPSSSQWLSKNPPSRDLTIKIPSRPTTADKDPSHSQNRQPSVLSWPQMEPAMELDERLRDSKRGMEERRVFESNYTMRPISRGGAQDRSLLVGPGGERRPTMSLPPLSVAIGSRNSYYAQ